MKRGKKLVCLLLVFVLLCGAAYAASRLGADGTAEQEAADSTVFSLDADSVTALSYTHGDTLAFEKENGEWVYTGDDAFPLASGYIDTMAAALSDISSSKTIDSPGDLSQYGLDEPEYSISVTAGETYSILIGDETAIGGERYLSTGDGKVYLVDSAITDSFSYGLYELVQEESVPAMSSIESFCVAVGEKSYELDYIENSGLAYSDDYVWFYKDGDGYLTLDTDLADSFVRKVTGLSWASCANYNADDAALAQYGLDEPQLTATVNYIETVKVETDMTDSDGNTIYDTREDEKTFTLEIGDYAGEQCYARIAGSRMVYLIDATVCDSLLHATYESLQPNEILSMDFDTVTSVDITLDGKTCTVRKSDGVWTLDGSETDIQGVFDTLNGLVPSDSGVAQTPEGSAELSFVFHRSTDKFSTVELSFYPYDSSSCLVSLDGEARLFATRTDLSSLKDELSAVLPG